nr:hypothetical protein CFP56_27572 [Quercus suber]
MIKKLAVAHLKKQGQALTTKVTLPSNVAPKRRGVDKDDRLTMKATGQSVRTNREDQPQKSPSPPCHGTDKGLMSAHGLVVSSSIQRLVSHKDYAVEMVNSIIKDTDLDECGEHANEDLGVSGLFDLARAMVRMKALQARCETKEGVVHRQCTLEQAKADAMAGFQTSQPHYDKCGGFYGNGFNDYLKQVVSFYPNLDLSQVVIDDTVPLTPGSVDAAMNEADGDVHLVKEEAKEPANVKDVSQNVLDGQPIPGNSTILDSSSTPEGPSTPKV